MTQEPLSSEYPEKSYLWPKTLGGQENPKGVYFPAESLSKLFCACDEHALRTVDKLRIDYDFGVYALMKRQSDGSGISGLVDHLLKVLERKGINRLRASRRGSRFPP